MALNRRQFLYLFGSTVGLSGLSLSGLEHEWIPALREPVASALLVNPTDKQAQPPAGPFTLPPLPYDYNALEPHIDAETMQFHHDKHHAAYINNLNTALSNYPDLQAMSAEELITQLDQLPEVIRTTVRNNGGGHINHSMFWQIMSPTGGGEPTGAIAAAITEAFGSFAAFQEEFNTAGSRQFGSGWAWLVRDQQGQLKVMGTPNQDSPLMTGQYPILANDVWEHAYYLTYRNRRGDYLNAWWNVVNWDEVNRRYEQAMTT